ESRGELGSERPTLRQAGNVAQEHVQSHALEGRVHAFENRYGFGEGLVKAQHAAIDQPGHDGCSDRLRIRPEGKGVRRCERRILIAPSRAGDRDGEVGTAQDPSSDPGNSRLATLCIEAPRELRVVPYPEVRGPTVLSRRLASNGCASGA